MFCLPEETRCPLIVPLVWLPADNSEAFLMKTRSWILGAVATVTGLVAAQAQVRTIGFNFGTSSGTASATSGSQGNFSVSPFTIGASTQTLTPNPSSATSPIPASNVSGASGGFHYDLAATTGAMAVGTSSYFEVTITPNTGFRVVINDFDFSAFSVTGTTGPTAFTLRSDANADNFATAIGVTIPSTLTQNSWARYDTTFSSSVVGALNTAVKLRLYTTGNSANVASAVANVSIDDVALSVTVPEASDCALYGCAAIVGFTWWRRSKKSVKQA